MSQKITVVILSLVLLAAGCELDSSQSIEPTAPKQAAIAPQSLPGRSSYQLVGGNTTNAPASSSACSYPAGWYPYQMHLNETVFSLASRINVSANDVLRANCLADAAALGIGSWLYLPVQAANADAQAFLPLGISAFIADPPVVPAGGVVNLAWQGQGPVVRARLGWVYRDQLIEEAGGLPSIGAWQLQVPADGRESITFMLLVSDGLREVAAQTTVRIRCPESWFFSPAPAGCPTAPLTTTFREQHFEHGTIVYIPALGVHYLLIAEQPAIKLADLFVPGMPLKDPALDANIPAGTHQPTGPINLAWNSDESVRSALGYAVGSEISYLGMLQRTVSATGETVFFSASSGQVYRAVNGQGWQVITPQ